MDMLRDLLSGAQQPEHQDFVNRYEQGHPSQGYSDEEVLQRYQQVAPRLPRDVYEESAQEAFARLSPQERREFALYLQQRARQQNLQYPEFDQFDRDDHYQDPGMLARVTSGLHQQQPDLLGQLLGGGGGLGGNPLGKAAMAGIAAMAMKKFMGR